MPQITVINAEENTGVAEAQAKTTSIAVSTSSSTAVSTPLLAKVATPVTTPTIFYSGFRSPGQNSTNSVNRLKLSADINAGNYAFVEPIPFEVSETNELTIGLAQTRLVMNQYTHTNSTGSWALSSYRMKERSGFTEFHLLRAPLNSSNSEKKFKYFLLNYVTNEVKLATGDPGFVIAPALYGMDFDRNVDVRNSNTGFGFKVPYRREGSPLFHLNYDDQSTYLVRSNKGFNDTLKETQTRMQLNEYLPSAGLAELVYHYMEFPNFANFFVDSSPEYKQMVSLVDSYETGRKAILDNFTATFSTAMNEWLPNQTVLGLISGYAQPVDNRVVVSSYCGIPADPISIEMRKYTPNPLILDILLSYAISFDGLPTNKSPSLHLMLGVVGNHWEWGNKSSFSPLAGRIYFNEDGTIKFIDAGTGGYFQHDPEKVSQAELFTSQRTVLALMFHPEKPRFTTARTEGSKKNAKDMNLEEVSVPVKAGASVNSTTMMMSPLLLGSSHAEGANAYVLPSSPAVHLSSSLASRQNQLVLASTASMTKTIDSPTVSSVHSKKKKMTGRGTPLSQRGSFTYTESASPIHSVPALSLKNRPPLGGNRKDSWESPVRMFTSIFAAKTPIIPSIAIKPSVPKSGVSPTTVNSGSSPVTVSSTASPVQSVTHLTGAAASLQPLQITSPIPTGIVTVAVSTADASMFGSPPSSNSGSLSSPETTTTIVKPNTG